MEWTREKTLCLINQYRARRGLWDMTHDDYRKKEIKQKLLVEVSDSLGGNIAITEIEKKFHTLRTQYHREINRMKRKEPYNSKWFGFKNLQFLSSPKACRTNKARIRSEIAEECTVTSKLEGSMQNDTSGGSANSSTIQEEFLTLHHKPSGITYETVVTTATSTPSNSRSQFEKLIEETTKDVEEENMEVKPKVTYKEITVPIDQQNYTAHIHVNPEISVTQHDDQHNQSSDESVHAVEMRENADGELVYANGSTHAQHHQSLQPRIIKIQRRDTYHDDDYYQENQQQHAQHIHNIPSSSTASTKRIYYDANGHTATIVAAPQTTSTTTGNSSLMAPITKYQPQQQTRVGANGNVKCRLDPNKSQHQTTQKPQIQRDAFATYGEYVANEMRGIANREILISLKHKINTALFEAHMAELQK